MKKEFRDKRGTNRYIAFLLLMTSDLLQVLGKHYSKKYAFCSVGDTYGTLCNTICMRRTIIEIDVQSEYMRRSNDTIQKVQEQLGELLNDYLTQKQSVLMQVKTGRMGKEAFLEEVRRHIGIYYETDMSKQDELLESFEQYVFGYSVLSPLIDDADISDIRVISYDNIRVKRSGERMGADVCFASEKEYRQFIDYCATKNGVSVSNMNAIQRFTDHDSHPDFILRFTISMPLVNTYDQPYLCIRMVPKDFPLLQELIQ